MRSDSFGVGLVDNLIAAGGGGPGVGVDNWLTETGESWLTEDGGAWLLDL
jgi:hypothetical protein